MNIKVGVIGYGVIGRGVVALLQEYGSVLEKRTDINIKVKMIADLNIADSKGLDLSNIKLTTDYKEIINDEEIDIVVELIGGTTIAYNIVHEAIEAKKHIITANKALIYEKGEQLFSLARDNKSEIRFEASVGGGIPVIKTITESLSGDIITKIYGVLNGTTNFILTKMEEENLTFEVALKQAQELGFAEADPTLDITGGDAAHKIKILSSIAFNTNIEKEKVCRKGITEIEAEDIVYAKELGYTLKLLAIGKRHDDKGSVEAHVYPTLVPSNSNIASVKNEYNVVMLESNYLGISHYVGKGAGERPTATSIVSDIVDISLAITDKRKYPDHRYASFNNYKTIDNNEIMSCYYLHIKTVEKVGILAEISKILASHNISISQIMQKKSKDNNNIPLIIITHEASHKSMFDAIAEIEGLDYTKGKTALLHLENI